MNIRLLFVFIIFSSPINISYAADIFPSTYYPTKNHPRLWLTNERLGALQAAQQQNTPRWSTFKGLCDSLIDTDSSNDPWNLEISPQSYTAPLALMYRLSNDNRYAVRAMELMDLISLDFSGYGDADHQPFYFMGLTYDWLYNYSGMTAAKKQEYRTKMKAISDQFWYDYNLTASGTDSDQNLLTGSLHLVLGAAMYGDTSDAVTLLDRSWKGWTEGYSLATGTSNRDMVRLAVGGAYYTGMAYFPSTDITGISNYWLTLSSALNYDINQKDAELKPFWGNIVRSLIHATEPNRQRVYDYGSWQDPNDLANQPWLRRAVIIASYFAGQAGNSLEASLARGYSDNVDIGDYNDAFTELFFSTPGASSVSPYNTTNANLPLIRFADEPDFLFFRDGWGTSANWGVFRGDGNIPIDQQGPDHGHFSLWRGDSYLTKGARNYESLRNGDFFNTLSIKSTCAINGESCSGTALFSSEKRASIPRHRKQTTGSLFAYGMLEADGQWNDSPTNYNPQNNVNSYRRHFVWAGKYAVVFDRLRTKVAAWSKYRLRALTEPVITGTIVSQLSTNGSHKLLQRTLEPSNIAINKINESVEWSNREDWLVNASERKWQSVIDLPTSTHVNVLNVIQTGSSSMTSFDTLEHITNVNSSGVRIGDWVVVLASEEVLRSTVSYAVNNPSASTKHLITDLDAGIYHVLINNVQTVNVSVQENDNTAFFETNTLPSTMNVTLQRYGSATPIAATLISPMGSISDSTPTYTWNAVAGSSWYYLWVDDSTGNKIKKWYTAAQTGCSSGTGTCSITSTTSLATGNSKWWVQTYNASGYGLWSNGMLFTVAGVPGKATLTSPSGTISDSTPSYRWNAVSGSTWYYLWVDDSTGNRIKKWYTAAQAGCSSGTGTCSITSTTSLATGNSKWWVQTYNASGYGLWSNGMSFSVAGVPGKATLTSPSGTISDSTPSYRWNAVSGSTWYYLWVDDSTGNRIKKWYTAAQAGCSSGTGTCSITSTTSLTAGNGKWWVQTYNASGYGLWSNAANFRLN